MSYVELIEKKMEDNLSAFRARIRKVRTGQANPALLESVTVIYYGSSTPLAQLSNISSPTPRSLLISPWDVKSLKDIEQALVKANLGVTPVNDGKVIRLNLPELTEDRRKELVKEVKKMAEKCKVDLRNNRRNILEEVKKSVKDKEISEDDQKHIQSEIQKTTDVYMQKVDQALQAKEKEIMEF